MMTTSNRCEDAIKTRRGRARAASVILAALAAAVAAAAIIVGCGEPMGPPRIDEKWLRTLVDTGNGGDAARKCTLTVAVLPYSSGTVTVFADSGSSSMDSITFHDSGAVVTLKSVAAPGYEFEKWTCVGCGINGSGQETENVTVSSNMKITANFQDTATVDITDTTKYTLKVTRSQDSDGRVFINDNESYQHLGKAGDTIGIRAVAFSGFKFVNWDIIEGDGKIGSANDSATTVIMKNSDVTVKAVFEQLTCKLTVNISPDSSYGSVLYNPQPVNGVYAHGTPVTVTATAKDGYTFDGWTTCVGCSIDGNNATVTVNSNLTITANFKQIIATPKDSTSWYVKNPNANNFEISTAAELAMLARIVNGAAQYWGLSRDNFSGKTITLTEDIDLAGRNWEPIGKDTATPFMGTFNGGGKIIRNLRINQETQSYQGLFGIINSGTVKNLGLDSVNVTGFAHVGSVAGHIYRESHVENCYSTGKVTGANNAESVGGLVGGIGNGSEVANCYSTATVNGTDNVGGVVGTVYGFGPTATRVTKCYSTGAVSGSNGVGGVVGFAIGVDVDDIRVDSCAALNPSVKVTGGGGGGRVVSMIGVVDGNMGAPAYNVAYAKMKRNDGLEQWFDKGANKANGEDITASSIQGSPTIYNRFIGANGWTVSSSRVPATLPGLFGKAVDWPAHLVD